MRNVLAAAIFVAMAGCGGGSFGGESYTSKALDEFRAGNAYDWRAKKKRPSAKDVTAVESKIKSVAAGSRKDFHQAFRVLSNQRDHDEIAFTTLAKSSFNRATYNRVFGEPENANTRDEPNTWAHTCSDGKVTLRGYINSKSEPDVVTTFPQKPKY
jgi:hypothetical protein